jgi:hypothetical protein
MILEEEIKPPCFKDTLPSLGGKHYVYRQADAERVIQLAVSFRSFLAVA